MMEDSSAILFEPSVALIQAELSKRLTLLLL